MKVSGLSIEFILDGKGVDFIATTIQFFYHKKSELGKGVINIITFLESIKERSKI